MKVAWTGDPSKSCKGASNKLSSEAIGNGKSCLHFPSSDALKSRDRAPATNTIQSIANLKSLNVIREMPAALDANGPSFVISEEELPPILKVTMQTPMVKNPFLPTSSSNSEVNQGFWPNNLIQLVREIVKQPSHQPLDPEFKFSLDRDAAVTNFNVLKSTTST